MVHSSKNTNKEIILIGYSGHAYVVADAILSQQNIIKGYCDQKAISNPLNINNLGEESEKLLINQSWVVAIGNNEIRRKVIEKFIGMGTLETIMHNSCILGVNVKIGKGSFLSSRTVINPLAQIGIGCIINTGAIIEHECMIGDYTHIAPGAVLAGKVKVGKNCFIGASAVIKQGVEIGDNVIVGAGSVVLHNVTSTTTVVGNPAKKLR